MLNLNVKYFSISERCGRNHQNKFLFTSPQGTIFPWELKPVRDELFIHLQRNSTQIQAKPTSMRIITEFLPENSRRSVDYECLPSFSTMQFAEIVDTNGVAVVPSFGIRSGNAF